MSYTGKRTNRTDFPKQLCLDPEMGARLRMEAVTRRWTIQGMTIYLMELGLKVIDGEFVPANSAEISSTQANSVEMRRKNLMSAAETERKRTA